MRCFALLAALAACGGSSAPPPAQPANTAPPEATEPASSAGVGGAAYGGDLYGGDPYGGGSDSNVAVPRTAAEWQALLARPIPAAFPACARYRDGFGKLSTCDKVPAASKDALYQGYEAFLGVFTQNLPPDATTAVNDACKQGSDALDQMLISMGCSP